jgi:hypothetical protein
MIRGMEDRRSDGKMVGERASGEADVWDRLTENGGEKSCMCGNKEQQVDDTKEIQKDVSGVKDWVELTQMGADELGTATSTAGGPAEGAAASHCNAHVTADEWRDRQTEKDRERARESVRQRERERQIHTYDQSDKHTARVAHVHERNNTLARPE